MIAGRPSGIAATARPTAARNMSAALYSRTSRPKAKVSPASPRMIRVSLRAKPAIWRRSGVSSVSTSASSVPTLPISVASPVATTMPLPSPLTTNVPACAIELRSPSGASAGTGATPLPDGNRFPGQRRLLNPQRLGLGQSEIGRHLVARLQEDDVARNQGVRRHHAAPAGAHHARLEREHLADRGERPLRLALLHEADERVDEDDARDDAAVHPLAEQRRDQGGPQQDVDQDAVELEQQAHERPAPLGRRQPVGSEALQTLGRLRLAQALWRRLERGAGRGGERRVPRATLAIGGVLRRHRSS